MIITCPACQTQFRLPEGALGASGRKLRCSACRHVWFAAPQIHEPEPADAPPAQAPGAEAQVAAVSSPATIRPPVGSISNPGPSDTIPIDEAGPDTAEPDLAVPPADDAPTAEETPAREPAPAPPADDQPVDAEFSDQTDETPEEPSPAAHAAPVEPRAAAGSQWEPGAVMPRGGTRHEAQETPRTGLRLVQPGTTPPPSSEQPAATPEAPARPAYDVIRVVAPDAAPEEDRRERPRRRGGGGAGLLLVLLLLIGIAGFAYFERTTVLSYLPQAAPLYAQAGLIGAPGSQGLQLEDVSFRVDDSDGETRIVVTGSVVNVGQEYRLLPALSAQLLNADKEATLTWTFDAIAEGLPPGSATLFEADYRDPPRTGEDDYVFVTFADRM